MIVKYSKKFTTGPWLNEDIGFEIELENTEGKPLPEAIQVTLGFLKQMAEKFHKDNNPQLVGGKYDNKMVDAPMWTTVTPAPIPEVQVEKPQGTMDQQIEAINSCTTIKELETYNLMTKALPWLREAYENKLINLQK